VFRHGHHLASNVRTNEEQIFAVMRYALSGGFS
jgi:hypothetical protein